MQTGRVAHDGQSRRVADVTLESAYIEVFTSTKSELCVPLRVDERIIGVVNAEEWDGYCLATVRRLSYNPTTHMLAVGGTNVHVYTVPAP